MIFYYCNCSNIFLYFTLEARVVLPKIDIIFDHKVLRKLSRCIKIKNKEASLTSWLILTSVENFCESLSGVQNNTFVVSISSYSEVK